MTLVQVAQTIGGFSAAIALIIAIVAGLVGFLQLRTQRQSHNEREYTNLFAQYLGARNELRELIDSADFDFNDAEAFEGAKFEIAQLLRFIRVISELSRNAGGASSSSDWILLADDADFIVSIASQLHAKAVTSMTMDVIITALAAARKLGKQNLVVQFEALQGQCEKISQDASLTMVEKSYQERALIAPQLDRMNEACNAADMRIGIRDNKNFAVQFRQLQQLSLMLAESRALRLKVNERSSSVVSKSIEADLQTFGVMDWGV